MRCCRYISIIIILLLLLYTNEDDTESVNEINNGHPYSWCDYFSCHDLAAVSTDLCQPITTSRHLKTLICTSTNHPATGSASDMRRTFATSREKRWGRHAYLTAVKHILIRLIPFETYFANKITSVISTHHQILRMAWQYSVVNRFCWFIRGQSIKKTELFFFKFIALFTT